MAADFLQGGLPTASPADGNHFLQGANHLQGTHLLLNAQNVFLILVLATVLCTLAGAWFAARSRNGMVWLFLVVTASAGISALVALLLLPMVAGFGAPTLLDAALILVVGIGAARTWAASLGQKDWISHF